MMSSTEHRGSPAVDVEEHQPAPILRRFWPVLVPTYMFLVYEFLILRSNIERYEVLVESPMQGRVFLGVVFGYTLLRLLDYRPVPGPVYGLTQETLVLNAPWRTYPALSIPLAVISEIRPARPSWRYLLPERLRPRDFYCAWTVRVMEVVADDPWHHGRSMRIRFAPSRSFLRTLRERQERARRHAPRRAPSPGRP